MAEKKSLKDLEAVVEKAIASKVQRLSGGSVVRSGLSTGSLMLNVALSGDPFIGFAWGRIVEIFGPEQTGKSTLALHCIAEGQKLDIPEIYIDAEHACDPVYMEAIGIDLNRLSFVQPDSGEQALTAVESAIYAGYKVVVVDSVAALVPRAELDGDMGDAHMGLQARLMSQAMRKLTGVVSKAGAVVIFINQIRHKIGVMFGSPETTAGGNALRFYASYRLDMRSPRGGAVTEKDLDGETETGIQANVKVIKNKVFPPFRRASFVVQYGFGINKAKDAIEFMRSLNMFERIETGKKKKDGSTVVVERAVIDGKQYSPAQLYEAMSDKTIREKVEKLIVSVVKKARNYADNG